MPRTLGREALNRFRVEGVRPRWCGRWIYRGTNRYASARAQVRSPAQPGAANGRQRQFAFA